MMCDLLPLTRGPFALTRTRVDLFRSLALRRAWTILREKIFFYCLRRTRGQYSIKRSDLCPPRWTFFVRADLLSVMGGPLSIARGPFSFIMTPSGLFCPLALRMRTILFVSGPFSIACVARVDSILSHVRTSARRVGPF